MYFTDYQSTCRLIYISYGQLTIIEIINLLALLPGN